MLVAHNRRGCSCISPDQELVAASTTASILVAPEAYVYTYCWRMSCHLLLCTATKAVSGSARCKKSLNVDAVLNKLYISCEPAAKPRLAIAMTLFGSMLMVA